MAYIDSENPGLRNVNAVLPEGTEMNLESALSRWPCVLESLIRITPPLRNPSKKSLVSNLLTCAVETFASSKSREPSLNLTPPRRVAEPGQTPSSTILQRRVWTKKWALLGQILMTSWVLWEIAKRLILHSEGAVVWSPKRGSAGENGATRYKGSSGHDTYPFQASCRIPEAINVFTPTCQIGRMPTYLRSHSPTTFFQLPLESGWISPPAYSNYYQHSQFPLDHELTSDDIVSSPLSAAPILATTTTPSLPAMRIPAPSVTRRSATQTGEPYRFATYPPGMAPKQDSQFILDPGLVDADTGHEVRMLPTRAHPDLPAAPRPGTPGPSRRLFEEQPARLAPNPRRVNSDVDMDDEPPKKVRRFGDKETRAHYRPLHRAIVKERKARESDRTDAKRRIGTLVSRPGPQNGSTAVAAADPGGDQVSYERESSGEPADKSAAPEFEQGNNSEGGTQPFLRWDDSVPALPSARHGPLVTRDCYSSISSGSSAHDSPTDFPSLLSPMLEDDRDEPFCYFAPVYQGSPPLSPTFDCRSPRPRSPADPRFAFTASPAHSFIQSEDDIPPLSDLSSDSDSAEFSSSPGRPATPLLAPNGYYTPAAPVAPSGHGGVLPFYHANASSVTVDEPGFA
ncbi:hypothetical protein DFH06DRAFT_1297493 [Mycena polygramma]|nr:hypothetical protein DFH06DRAFT_1297493 [Mycena polygramma]